jgi:transcriptional regulator with XRE-family HTH domain
VDPAIRTELAAARVRARLTQKDVAVRLGRAQGHVSKFERGLSDLSVPELFQVAEMVGADSAAVFRALGAATAQATVTTPGRTPPRGR